MQSRKTVADIWEEVQAEQRRFNRIVRYLIGALILAFLIAGIAAVQSWMKFNSLGDSYQIQIDRSFAQAAISRSDSNRQRQNMRIELIELRESISEQRASSDLPRRVDRTLSTYGDQGEFESIEALLREAVALAEASALGTTLNTSTAYLVEAVLGQLSEPTNTDDASLLSSDQRSLLLAALQKWISPLDLHTEQHWRTLAEEASDPYIRGLGLAGLGSLFYERAQASEEGLNWENGCERAVDNIRQAQLLGAESVQLLLFMGECLRKNGEKLGAFRAFLAALQQQTQTPDMSINDRRLAAHGAGTTLIALDVSAETDPILADQIKAFTKDIRALNLTDSENDEASVLDEALALLEHAVELRELRGEGEIGKIYTSENIGFIYLQLGDWKKAIEHARLIDQEMAMAWNLTVLVIALETLADKTEVAGDNAEASKLRSSAQQSIEKMRLMPVSQFDRAELEKLLSSSHILKLSRVFDAIDTPNGNEP